MVIGGRNKLSQFNDIALVANNYQLENVTKFKYLGVQTKKVKFFSADIFWTGLNPQSA